MLRLFTRENIALTGALLICLISGKFIQYQRYLAILLLGCAVCVFDRRSFYLFAPIFLFFQVQFYVTGTNTAFRFYSILVIGKAVLELKELRLRGLILPAFLVVLTHVLLCLMDRSASLGFSAALDLAVVLIVVCRVPEDKATFRKFFLVLGLAGLCSGAYGYLTHNFGSVSLGRAGVYSSQLERFMLTFIDPNYAGFFVNIAFFSILCIRRPLKWWMRLPVLGALLYFLLLTSSVTNFACFGLCTCAYVVLRWPKKSPLLLLGLLAALAAAVYAIVYVDFIGNISALSGIKTRLEDLLRNFTSGDVDSMSSGRSELWAHYFNYFQGQDLLHKLIGGNVLTPNWLGDEMTKAVGMVSHLAYLQALLQYGILGALIIFGTQAAWTVYHGLKFLMYQQRDDDADVWRAYILCKIAMLLFATSVDIFPDWRFMLILFL